MKRTNSLKSLEKKIELLSKLLNSLGKKIEKMNGRINELVEVTVVNNNLRAKTEHFTERDERTERILPSIPSIIARNRLVSSNADVRDKHDAYIGTLKKIRGRHREILVMLINNGFHTYKDIARKLDISQSRARAYISELKKFGVPLKQIRDPEGYKVGVDLRFVEEILSK